MDSLATARLEGTALDAWRSYLQSHATILRELDAQLVAEHELTTRDYEVLLYLAQAPERKLPMSVLASSTMLTRSGITRLVDGLVSAGLIERLACPSDARISYAKLTDSGYEKLRDAGCHLFLWSTCGADYCRKVAAIHSLTDFFEGFSAKPDIVIDDMPSTCTGAFAYGVGEQSWPELADRIIDKHID